MVLIDLYQSVKPGDEIRMVLTLNYHHLLELVLPAGQQQHIAKMFADLR